MVDLTGIGDKVGNVKASDFLGIFSSEFFTQVYFFMKIMFWMALAVFIVILFWKYYLQFKVKATIYTGIGANVSEYTKEGAKVGEYVSTEMSTDSAKIVLDKQGKRKLVFLKLRNGKERVTTPIPLSKFKGKKGRSDHYTFFMDNNYFLHPIGVDTHTLNHESLKVNPHELSLLIAWERNERKQLESKFKKKDMLDKWIPIGVLVMSMVLGFLICFFAFQEIGGGLSGLTSQFAQVASSCTRLG